MPSTPTPAGTLRAEVLADTERYLSALHGAVARHDNLGANLTCAGCQLRDRLRRLADEAQQPEAAPVDPAPGCGDSDHRHLGPCALYARPAHVVTEETPNEQEPTQLRLGLGDVLWGDDGTATLMLSGPGGAPYWLELDADRAAALRDDLGGPGGGEVQQDTAQSQTEAYPAQHRWMAETYDDLAREWDQGMPCRERADALARHRAREERYPTWADGTPVQRRLVRETTTFTVEPVDDPDAAEEPTP
ncbi:hypothetical protein OG786_29160 [Streptomyces sp. NBC_00101]|uniref:hypothetical protein n=1 Tax=Streptomyces sp. NBC_00101 TaxID=2975651 RepID=UPI0032495488